MGIEKYAINDEKPAVSMSREQFDRIRNTFGDDMDSESFTNELDELGIKVDSGIIDIIVDGEPMKIDTSQEDFGTVLE